VEAEVGPIKYIAKFIYGEDGANENMLEKAVTWVIILIVVVFDPLAVIMLLGAQMTFGWAREQKEQDIYTPDPYIADVGEKPTEEELKDDFLPTYDEITPKAEEPVVNEQTHPYLYKGDFHKRPEGMEPVPPMVATPAEHNVESEDPPMPLDQWNKMIEEAERAVQVEKTQTTLEDRLASGESYIDGEGKEHSVTNDDLERPGDYLTPNYEGVKLPDTGEWVQTGPDFEDESKKKTYITKDELGHQQVKTRD
jgi:hypothetical protein